MAKPCLIKYNGKWYERGELSKHLRDEGGLENIIKELKSKASRKPITPEESSNYANLTEDKDGNLVFFHRGGKDYETIKKSSGKTLATSKEEAAALGRAGGAAMYYTHPEDAETMVSGSHMYSVKVPKDKVYDFNSDPENLIEEARDRFKEDHPDIAFSPNDQLAYMTKIAGEKGYDMVVADWDGKTRAQTTKEFKPDDVQITEGNALAKKFNEEYVKNTKKGYKSIVPETKAQKLKEVYQEINKERNKENKYDKLYRLNENSEKMEQPEITKMIEESDISQELKDKYKEAVEFKEEKRRTEVPNKVIGESVEVENAPKGNHLNIGLLEGRTNELMSSEEVLSKLPKDVDVISSSEIKGTEPSISVEISRPLTDSEMIKLLDDTKQQAIPQLSEGKGILYDTKRGTSEGWGEFNPELFFTQDGKPLKEAAVAEVKPELKTKLEAFKAKHIEPVEKAKEGVRKSVENAKKSLTKLLPNIEIVEHENSESFKKVAGKNARGFFDSENGKIHINLEKANARTVAHEVFHALLLDKVKTDENIQNITKKMVDAVSKSLEKNSELKSQLEDFVKNYSENIKNEEKLAELFGHLADGYEGFDAPTKSFIKRALDRIAVALGLKPFTEGDVVDMLKTVSGKLAAGEEITERDIKAISEGASSYISEPTEVKRFQNANEEKVKLGDHELSFVKKSDIIDFNSLMKEISDKKQKVWFWVADQLGRGNYFDKVIDGEHYLDAGPSFALDPINRDKNVIWATGKNEKEIGKLIGNSDYIFIISGSPEKSKLFNKSIIDIVAKRAGDFDAFKKDVLESSKIKSINDILSSVKSWEELKDSVKRKDFLLSVLDQKEKNTPLKKTLDKYNSFVDMNELRDGFYKDNNFELNDVMLVLKPTGFGGKSEHSTYENNILGDVVGVPDIKVNAFDIMPSEIKNKYREDLGKSQQQQAVAPYGIGVKQIERFQESGDYADMKDIVKDLIDDGKSITEIKKIISSELGEGQVSLAERAYNDLAKTPETEFEPSEKVTSVKNEVTAAERAERGLAPVEQFEKYNSEHNFNKTKERVDSGELTPRSTAKSIINNPKGTPITHETQDSLAYDRMRLSNEYDQALKNLEKNPNDSAYLIEIERIEKEIEENDIAARMAGTIPSHALLARKNAIKQDYSLDRMVLKYKAKNNGEISAEKRAEFKELSDKLKQAEAKLEEYENNVRSKVEERVFSKIKKAAESETKKSNLKTERENLYAKLREMRFPKGKFQEIEPTDLPNDIAPILNHLAKNLIMDGVDTLDGVIDDIHSNLSDIFEGITKRDIRDILSGYGKISEPSKDEVASTLREIKSQGRLVSALEDVESGKAPLRTGFQRGEPSDKVRELQRKVQELMKENGITKESTDPERAWKTALDGIKTRLKNQIKDLEKQITTGEKTPKKQGVAYDEEAKALKERRDALKSAIEAVEGKREISDEQRVKMAVSALEKSISDYERRIKERDINPKERVSKTPETEEIKILREIRDNVKAEYEQMKEDMNPKKTPEERALATLKTRLRRREAELQEKLDTGNFEKKERRVVTPDEEAMKLKANVNRLKNKFDMELKKKELANRPKYKKALDFAATLRRTMLLTGVKVLGKLGVAAGSRTLISPVEEITGGLLSKLPGLSKISEKAPRQGGFSVKAEKEAISQWFRKETYKEMKKIISTGKGTLDLLHGKEDLPPSSMDIFGQIHKAEKEPARRNEYYRSFIKRMEAAAREGIDTTDEVVKSTIAAQSYIDANKAIFMQDNIATNAYKSFLASLERSGTKGEVAATALKIILPIVKVPTNYAAEVTSYAGGYAKALPLIGKAIINGVDSLTPEQSDYVMKNLKKGSVGAAVLLLGFFNPQAIGGYYQRGEKREEDEVKAGGIKLFGEDLPRWMVHTPLLECLQIGATLRRVTDTYEQKGKEGGKFAAGLAVGKGLVEEVPFAKSPEEALKALTGPEEAKKYAKHLGESFINPQFLQDFGVKIFKEEEKKEEETPSGERIIR